jgi:putative ABC transport system permease protein
MNFVALKMLFADRAKYFSLIFAIAFASFLLANQVSIFIGIMTRPASQIQGVVDADIWVMDPQTLYGDEVSALRDYDLYRVRSVPGVEWAVPLYKGNGRARGPDGRCGRFHMLESVKELHNTPFGSTQQFCYCLCRIE